MHSKPHKLWLCRAFVRKIQTDETAHFKCTIKQNVHLSWLTAHPVQWSCFNFSELYERLFYERFKWCVWGIGSKQHTGVSKANSASSHIWLKTELRIDSEILRIDPESLEKESEWINFFPLPPLSVHHCPEEFVLGYVIVFMYRPRCNYCIKTFLYDFHVNSNQCIIKIDLWCHICNLWLVSPSAV